MLFAMFRIDSEVKIRINLRVPGYTAFLDDGTSIELEPKEHNIELNEVAGYSISNLLADLSMVTIWGSYQDPTFWYWDTEQNGLISVTTDVLQVSEIPGETPEHANVGGIRNSG
jgi:hypothetical protein